MAANQHLYQLVYEKLLDRILTGEIESGNRLPSENELAEQFEVSRITAKKAMNMLAEEGYIVRRPGLGSYVQLKEENRQEAAPAAEGPAVKKKIIGLVMEDLTGSFGLEMLRGIEAKCNQLGYYLCIKRSMGDQKIEEAAIDRLLSLGVDGIIIMPTHGEHYNKGILRMVVEGYPIVFVDRFLSGIPASYVGTDNKKAAEALTDYLIQMGHRDIAMFTAPGEDAVSLSDRIDGFVQAQKKRGLKFDKSNLIDNIRSTIPNNHTPENTRSDSERIEEFLSKHPNITAAATTEYGIAVLVRRACQKLGVRVPEDLSIVCFDEPSITWEEHSFTHMEQNEREIGENAVQILNDQICAEPEKRRPVIKVLDAVMVKGDSVASLYKGVPDAVMVNGGSALS